MSAARSRPERNSIFWLDLPRGRMRTGMDWVSQWMDECKCWRPKHCNSKNGMNAWEKPLRRGIWMEKEKGGWMRFARSEISAEFWRIGPRCHDSPIRSIPIFKHFAPDIGRGCGIRNLWNQKSLDFPDGSNLKTFWYQVNINVYPFLKSIHTLTFPFLYLHWTASIRQRADVLQCLQKRHSPSHEMDWVAFYSASYLLSSSW